MTEVRPEQYLNAPLEIPVTLLGIVIDVRLEQPSKALPLISVTPLPIVQVVIALH